MIDIKLIKPLPEIFKIKVTPFESEILQKHLFEIGKTWFNNRKEIIKGRDERYLFVDNNRDTKMSGQITYATSKYEWLFVANKNPEILFDEYFTK